LNNWTRTIAVLMSPLLLVACNSISHEPHQTKDLARLSAVTVSSPRMEIRAGDRLAWRRSIIWARSENLAETDGNISPSSIMVEIQRQLVQKGYLFESGEQKPDYHIVAAVILGDSQKGAAIAELARLYPALGDSVDELGKGTLMLGIARPGSRDFEWRSAIQLFIAENPQLSQQRERIHDTIARLLRSLP